MSGRILGINCPSFNIFSKDRDSGTIENFIHNLQIDQNHGFNNVALVSARIPKSYYTAQSSHGNLTFGLHEDGLEQNITIPEGNYNSTNFAVVLKGLLDAASVLMGHTYVYTVTSPNSATEPQTFKYTYTVTGNAGVQPYFHMHNESFRISEFLGFLNETNNVFVGDSLTSFKPFRFEHTEFITIKSNISRNSGSSHEDASVLARIPVGNITAGDIIEYRLVNLEDSTRVMTNRNSNAFSFTLHDDQDRLINLNYYDWSCTIMLYEYNNDSELTINDLRIKYIKDPLQEALIGQIPGIESSALLAQEETGIKKEETAQTNKQTESDNTAINTAASGVIDNDDSFLNARPK